MNYIVSVAFRPLPGKRDIIATLIKHMLEQTRKFDGCVQAHLCHETSQNDVVIWHMWENQAAFEAYLDARAERGELHVFNDFLADEQIMQTYNVL